MKRIIAIVKPNMLDELPLLRKMRTRENRGTAGYSFPLLTGRSGSAPDNEGKKPFK